jgi:hypothetical protein
VSTAYGHRDCFGPDGTKCNPDFGLVLRGQPRLWKEAVAIAARRPSFDRLRAGFDTGFRPTQDASWARAHAWIWTTPYPSAWLGLNPGDKQRASGLHPRGSFVFALIRDRSVYQRS